MNWKPSYLEENSLASTSIFISIAIMIVSFIGGLSFFYVSSYQPRKVKKQQLDQLMSFLINYIIYIWIGKVLAHFTTFIKDPLAVLAYPSNSTAFYYATILIVVHLLYRMRHKKAEMFIVLQTSLPVFLSASFLYEFLQVIVAKNQISWGYLTLLMVFILLYLFMQGKGSIRNRSLIIFYMWIFGQFLLSFYSNITIFDYMISPIFLICLFVIVLFFQMFNRKGKV